MPQSGRLQVLPSSFKTSFSVFSGAQLRQINYMAYGETLTYLLSKSDDGNESFAF